MALPETLRDGNGRFAPGTAPGPGRPPSKAALHRQALADAVAPEVSASILRRVARSAAEGNLAAARLYFERTAGRPGDAPAETEPLTFELPRLKTIADCTKAIDRIAEANCAGVLTDAKTKLFLDLVAARMKSIELNDLERRLGELEKAAASVELPGHR